MSDNAQPLAAHDQHEMRGRLRSAQDAPVVYVVDDDPAVLKGLARLLRSAGMEVVTYGSAHELMVQRDLNAPGCLVLDVSMPGLGGLELQKLLAQQGDEPAIVFLTGHGNIPMGVQAMKRGAVDFLTKPVNDVALLKAVSAAIERDRTQRLARAQLDEIRQCYATLTPREREVMQHVIAGRLNKQTAADLGTVEKTIKVHRSRIMQKMKVDSLAELVRIAERAGITGP